MTRPRPLRLGAGFEVLESRDVPALFGIPWADSGHLTLSFVPDGTPTPNGPSALFKTMNAVAPTATWEREILRAFEKWASQVNVDVGVVNDDGSPLGVSGAVQSDRRFGDIRIAAVPLHDSDEVAAASPFSWTGTTFSGDVVFDSTRSFRIGNYSAAFDIFSVTMHEAGHTLGLDHSTASDSVMGEDYRFVTGLGTGDKAAIQSLYGARAADAFDAARSNNTAAYATAIPKDPTLPGRFTAKGDLGAADVDYFKFTVPLLGGLTGISVRATADGQTLLTPDITVYDSAGRVVASGRSLDPMQNDISLRFPSTLLGGVYTVKVNSATTDFAVGGYQLTVDFLTLGSLLAPVTNLLSSVLDFHSNDSLSLATLLAPQPKATPDARFDYGFRGVIEDSRDVDNYKIRASSGATQLNVIVWGLDVDALDPAVHIFDANNKPVAFQVLANDRGVFSLQITGVVGGQDYYVQILARTPGDTGSYYLGADFNAMTPTAFDALITDSVGAASKTDSLVIGEAALYDFAISAAGSAGSGVKLSLFDSTGAEVFSLSALAGSPTATRIAYLREGTYTVRYSVIGNLAANYNTQLLALSDPVGPYASSTTSTSPSSTSTSGSSTSTSSSSTYTYSSSSSTQTSYGSWYSF